MSLPLINMWDSIGKVSSGFTLLALVIVAALFAYRIKMIWNLRNLKNSKGNERIRIIKILSDRYEIDISGLTKSQQYSIVMEQLSQKKQRYFLQTIIFTIFMTLFSLIALYSINKSNDEKKEITKNNGNTNGTTNTPSNKSSTPSEKSLTNGKTNLVNAKENNKHITTPPLNVQNNEMETTVASTDGSIHGPRPTSLEETLTQLKVTTDKVKLISLQRKARSILQPQYNFGTISIKKKFGDETSLSQYKFKSYDYSSNILELNLNRASYYNYPNGINHVINTNVKIDLNKPFTLDMDYDSSFGIACVSLGKECVTLQPISGVCSEHIKLPFPECLNQDPGAFYAVFPGLITFYNTNNKKLNMLYNALKIEHNIINPNP